MWLRNNRRQTILLIGLVLVFIIFLSIINYFRSTQTYKISFENSNNVKVHDVSNAIDKEKKHVKDIGKSGDSIRLKNGYRYDISYKGNDGYESGDISISTPSSAREIKISPYYSSARLSDQLNKEVEPIHQKVKSHYRNIHLYEIQKGRLYHYGEWYGTTLKYVGSDPFNSDTLRIVLKKESGVWVVKTDPPNISLSKFDHPDIPEDILRDINRLQ